MSRLVLVRVALGCRCRTYTLSSPIKLLDDEGEIHYQRNTIGFDDYGTEELEAVTVLNEENLQVAQELTDLLQAKHLGSFSQRVSAFMGIVTPSRELSSSA